MSKHSTTEPMTAGEFVSVPDDALLSAKQLASLMGVSLVTLSRRRNDERGPPFLRLSATRTAYPVGLYRAWIASQARGIGSLQSAA